MRQIERLEMNVKEQPGFQTGYLVRCQLYTFKFLFVLKYILAKVDNAIIC